MIMKRNRDMKKESNPNLKLLFAFKFNYQQKKE